MARGRAVRVKASGHLSLKGNVAAMAGRRAPKHHSEKKIGPGRPEGNTQNREQILDAAETCFAITGYSATSLRDITAAAGVTQAMVNYYFGSKRELFRQVYLRRGELLNKERLALLEEVTARTRYSASDVIRAYLVPVFRLQSEDSGKHYLRLQARLHTEPDEFAYRLRQEVYDVPVRAYVQVLCQLLPNIDERTIYIRFTELIGIYLYILSGAHRLDQISEGKYNIPTSDEMIEQIVEFATHGMES